MTILPALIRAVAAWLLIMLAESVQGVLRRLFLVSWIGLQRASQVGVLVAIVLIAVVAVASARWIGLRRAGSLLMVGALWVLLSLAFEIGLGRALGYGWDRIFADYDLSRGGLMPLGLLAMLAAPLVAARIRGLRPPARRPQTLSAPFEARPHRRPRHVSPARPDGWSRPGPGTGL